LTELRTRQEEPATACVPLHVGRVATKFREEYVQRRHRELRDGSVRYRGDLRSGSRSHSEQVLQNARSGPCPIPIIEGGNGRDRTMGEDPQ
jgi:hypothetical protein